MLDLFPLEVQREIYRSECRNCEVDGKRIEPEELPEELELSNLLDKEPDISSLTVWMRKWAVTDLMKSNLGLPHNEYIYLERKYQI